MTTARQRIMLDDPVDLLVWPTADDDDEPVTAAAAFRFDPSQRRDSDGQWTDGTLGGVDISKRSKISASLGALDVSTVRIADGPRVRLAVGAFGGDDDGEATPGTVVDLDASTADRLRARIAADMVAGRQRQRELNAKWGELEKLEGEFRKAQSDARDRRDPETLEYAPEDRARIDAIQAQLDPLYDWSNTLEVDDVISDGVFPGTGDHDIAYQLRGVDDAKGGWEFVLAPRPRDAGADWDPPHPEEGDAVVLESTGASQLQRAITDSVDALGDDGGSVLAARAAVASALLDAIE